MHICFGTCGWFEMADVIFFFLTLSKSMKYFSGSTILQRTTKKPLYFKMTACAVCSSVENVTKNSNAFILFLGYFFSFGQRQGEMKYAAKHLCEMSVHMAIHFMH